MRQPITTERLEKALHSLDFALGDLRQAHTSATPTEALLIINVQMHAQTARASLNQLLEAMSAQATPATPAG